MTLANVGHDLNAAAKGRFNLGLGSQIRPHITKRYSMPWSSPAARMREMILAMRAIWACWHEGVPLEFLGKFYTHTLMTPFFTPTNIESGPPKVYLAAVGPMMAEVAGEVADGLLVHGFTTQAYLENVTLPAIERGFAKSGRKRENFEISYPVFAVTGRDETEIAAEETKMRQQIAFYGSTPAYKPVLDSIEMGELQPELNAMSKQGRWEAMGELIDDKTLNAISVQGDAREVARQIKSRYSHIADRTAASYSNMDQDDKVAFLDELQGD